MIGCLFNRESGNGFSDIIIEAGYDDDAFGIVMELKWSDDEKSLDQNCRDALEQIDTRQIHRHCAMMAIENFKIWNCIYHKKSSCYGRKVVKPIF